MFNHCLIGPKGRFPAQGSQLQRRVQPRSYAVERGFVSSRETARYPASMQRKVLAAVFQPPKVISAIAPKKGAEIQGGWWHAS
mgnify:CR=1 FL=1